MREAEVGTEVRIEAWGKDDLAILQKALGDPAMMIHLGGPESPQKIADRQTRYEQPGSRQYRIVVDGEGAGWVGYWERDWLDQDVYEIGWSVLPSFQGRGAASAATAQALELARAEHGRRFVHAYPSVENAPSNAICRKLEFELLGEHDFEWPPSSGQVMRCNDWRFDLFATA
jgi:RimJ/RimL family protein N-acetyltransferase